MSHWTDMVPVYKERQVCCYLPRWVLLVTLVSPTLFVAMIILSVFLSSCGDEDEKVEQTAYAVGGLDDTPWVICGENLQPSAAPCADFWHVGSP